jgi:flavin reductase (DIM6/NTAB) family NADH-FMN oxidoreductase RutF
MSVDPDTFRAAMGRFATGVTVVTTRDAAGADCGMTVSSFTSVSLHPPLVLVCIGHDASMYSAIMESDTFGVSVLAHGQEAISRHFADTDALRFEGIGFTRGESGVALLEDALAWIECEVVERVEAGDHTIVIGQVQWASAHADHPLLYYRGGYAQLDR